VEKPTRSRLTAPEQHHEAGEFEQSLRASIGAPGTEVQRRRILDNTSSVTSALLDEFFPVGLAEARGDIPVDVADVVARCISTTWSNSMPRRETPSDTRR